MQVVDRILCDDDSFRKNTDGQTIGQVVAWLSSFPKESIFSFVYEYEYDYDAIKILTYREETEREAEAREVCSKIDYNCNRISHLISEIKKLEFQKIFYVTRYKEQDQMTHVNRLQTEADALRARVKELEEQNLALKEKTK